MRSIDREGTRLQDAQGRPVLVAASKALGIRFAVEIRRGEVNLVTLKVFEGIDVDDGDAAVFPTAARKWKDAAVRAYIKFGGLMTEAVNDYLLLVFNPCSDTDFRVGGPACPVHSAIAATAGAPAQLGRLARPVHLEFDIAAVTVSPDIHQNVSLVSAGCNYG